MNINKVNEITNFGNTCFINSSLQLLCSAPNFVKFIMTNNENKLKKYLWKTILREKLLIILKAIDYSNNGKKLYKNGIIDSYINDDNINGNQLQSFNNIKEIYEKYISLISNTNKNLINSSYLFFENYESNYTQWSNASLNDIIKNRASYNISNNIYIKIKTFICLNIFFNKYYKNNVEKSNIECFFRLDIPISTNPYQFGSQQDSLEFLSNILNNLNELFLSNSKYFYFKQINIDATNNKFSFTNNILENININIKNIQSLQQLIDSYLGNTQQFYIDDKNELPMYFIIPLARFIANPNGTKRQQIITQVSNVEENINVSYYDLKGMNIDIKNITHKWSDILNNRKIIQYKLKAFIIKIGPNLNSGHYITYRKIKGFWYICNDNTITKNITLESALIAAKSAYIYLYEQSNIIVNNNESNTLSYFNYDKFNLSRPFEKSNSNKKPSFLTRLLMSIFSKIQKSSKKTNITNLVDAETAGQLEITKTEDSKNNSISNIPKIKELQQWIDTYPESKAILEKKITDLFKSRTIQDIFLIKFIINYILKKNTLKSILNTLSGKKSKKVEILKFVISKYVEIKSSQKSDILNAVKSSLLLDLTSSNSTYKKLIGNNLFLLN